MTRMMAFGSALLWLLLASRLYAQDDTRLALDHVLDSVHAHHPLIAAELANVRAADGEAFSARGEFDPQLTLQARITPAGYYDPKRFDVVLEQPTPVLGASLYAGYRIARGRVAPYYGEQRTLDGGEVRGGVRVPLLQDRALDARRAGVRSSELQREASEQGYRKLLLDLERDAAAAYYAWVAAGRKLSVSEGLVALADQRDTQIKEKVALGALPPIEALDNRRSILERRQKLVQARRAFEKAAIDLSLFLRGPGGEPQLPNPAHLPDDVVAVHTPPFSPEQGAERALEQRPELAQLKAQLGATRVERDLAQTRVQPRLDAFAEVSKDVGSGPTDIAFTLAPTVVETGATLSVPLGLRKARGKLRASEQKVQASEQKLAFARDKVRSEVLDALSQWKAADERVELARNAADAALAVASGERERFDLGASTVLFVNLREQAAADAQMALIDARAEAGFAALRAKLVTGDLLHEP